MKFDGYYILSDLIEMPNLRASSFRYLKQFLCRYVLGMPVPGAELSSRTHQIWLFYGAAATLWLVSVVSSICIGFLIKLPALGVWITLSSIYGVVLMPTRRLFTFLQANRDDIPLLHWPRVLVPLGILGALVYLVGFLPLTTWVEAPCVILPEQRATVRAEVPGFVDEVLTRDGDRVTADQALARLANPQLRLQLRAAELELDVADALIDQALRGGQTVLVAGYRETRKAYLERVEELRQQVAGLTLSSPIDGVVLTPRLDWAGDLHVGRGESFCEVADLATMVARIVVNERDLVGLGKDAQAQVRLRAYPGDTFSGTVQDVSPTALEQVPDLALSSRRAGGDVPTYPDARAREVPTVQLFELTIRLDNSDGRLRPGMTGAAKARGPARTLAGRALARVQKSLKSDFHLR